MLQRQPPSSRSVAKKSTPPLDLWRCEGDLSVLTLAKPPIPRLDPVPFSLQERVLDVSLRKLVSFLCHLGEVEGAPSTAEHQCLCPNPTSDVRVMVTNDHQRTAGLKRKNPPLIHDIFCCGL